MLYELIFKIEDQYNDECLEVFKNIEHFLACYSEATDTNATPDDGYKTYYVRFKELAFGNAFMACMYRKFYSAFIVYDFRVIE